MDNEIVAKVIQLFNNLTIDIETKSLTNMGQAHSKLNVLLTKLNSERTSRVFELNFEITEDNRNVKLEEIVKLNTKSNLSSILTDVSYAKDLIQILLDKIDLGIQNIIFWIKDIITNDNINTHIEINSEKNKIENVVNFYVNHLESTVNDIIGKGDEFNENQN